MDRDGYPDDEELKHIAEWPYTDIAGLLKFVKSLWAYQNYWRENGLTLEISTGGWSRNESLIDAMSRNTMFWTLCWESSRRGGHYMFNLLRINNMKKATR